VKNSLWTLAAAAIFLVATSSAFAEQSLWRFDNLKRIGGMSPKVEGAPQLVDSPVGKAVQFNGSDTALFFPGRRWSAPRPLPSKPSFRPEGGDFQQRWMHIAETDPATAWTPIRRHRRSPIRVSCSKCGW
jgi:hypothetical protein